MLLSVIVTGFEAVEERPGTWVVRPKKNPDGFLPSIAAYSGLPGNSDCERRAKAMAELVNETLNKTLVEILDQESDKP